MIERPKTRAIHRSTRLLLPALALALGTQACTYHRAYVDYDEYHRVSLSGTSLEGEALGKVEAHQGGAIWKDCTDVARGTLWVLVDETRRLGGNAVGDLHWFADRSRAPSDRPTCKRRWVWFLAWPGFFTPAFMSARVEGVAYRLEGPEEASGSVVYLPEDEAALRRAIEALLAARP
jgi:hypothetical protein